MKTLLIAGARPNFMKVAPIHRAAARRSRVCCDIVHTGQHYDHNLSGSFFAELGLPKPAHFLGAGSGSHAEQTARIMTSFEKVCMSEAPDLVMVVGDVNSTLACAISAKKLGIRVAHVEAGLRSRDMSMPEEINRLVTDSITDDFFVTEQSGVDNLLREGKPPSSIHFVGHVMIDNLYTQLRAVEKMDSTDFATNALKKVMGDYVFVTLHRPSNVDSRSRLEGIVEALNRISSEQGVFFPVHPRTKSRMEGFGIELGRNIVALPPLSFRESLFLWKDAGAVLTDSGGLQEETSALGVPCVTLRENTERPVTVEQGTNEIAGTETDAIIEAWRRSKERRGDDFQPPPLWDGHASQRIWDVLDDCSGQ